MKQVKPRMGGYVDSGVDIFSPGLLDEVPYQECIATKVAEAVDAHNERSMFSRYNIPSIQLVNEDSDGAREVELLVGKAVVFGYGGILLTVDDNRSSKSNRSSKMAETLSDKYVRNGGIALVAIRKHLALPKARLLRAERIAEHLQGLRVPMLTIDVMTADFELRQPVQPSFSQS